MAASIFMDKLQAPEAGGLTGALGGTACLWDDLKRRMASQYAPLAEEWVYSGKNHGWSLRLKQKKRAIVYMTPCQGYFRVAFALGEKAVQAAHQGGLPEPLLALIDNSPRYPEGRGVRMEVRSAEDVGLVEKLAAVKMAN